MAKLKKVTCPECEGRGLRNDVKIVFAATKYNPHDKLLPEECVLCNGTGKLTEKQMEKWKSDLRCRERYS